MIRFPLGALVSGFLLSACGGIPEESPGEEALGTKESELCYDASVSSLTVQGVSTYDGVMAGSGGYSVAGGANGVRLEYYADGVLKYYEERQGVSNSWNYSWGGFACGTHNFQVKAVPMVISSDGTRATCSSTYVWSAVHDASQPCMTPSSTLSCSRTTSTQIKCTGTGSGGSGSYTPVWQEVYDGYPYGWFDGAWTQYFYCATSTACSSGVQSNTGEYSAARLPVDGGCTYYERLQVQFKVRDSSGAESTVNTHTGYNCYY
jgi:hypothetical protein